MYIKNIKEANFWLCLWETFFDIGIMISFWLDKTSIWIMAPIIFFGIIAIIITWVDYIENVTKKEDEHETVD